MRLINVIPRLPSPMEYLNHPWDRIAYKKIQETIEIAHQEYKNDIVEEILNQPRAWWRI